MYAPCGICIGLLLTFASNGPQLRALRMFRELCVILTVGLPSFQLQKYRINKIVNLFQFYVQTLHWDVISHNISVVFEVAKYLVKTLVSVQFGI